jgi:hypothetical protein
MSAAHEDEEDIAFANAMNATFPVGEKPMSEEKKTEVPPAERETSPELTDEAREVIEMLTAAALSGLKVLAGGLGLGWNSLCLIGPSLARIATAHENLVKEAEIFNKAYHHDIGQRHHSVR